MVSIRVIQEVHIHVKVCYPCIVLLMVAANFGLSDEVPL